MEHESVRDIIKNTRERIEDKLSQGHKAYGMNTLFGHNDKTGVVDPEDFRTLLKQHLVGTPRPIDPLLVMNLIHVKLSQIEQGETGISLQNCDALYKVKETRDYHGWMGDMELSYGSGSVIPGAWFAYNLSQRGVDISVPGDLMALINGDYISVGYTKYLIPKYKQALSNVKDYTTRVSDAVKYEGIQAPVSVRDSSPFQKACSMSIGQLDETVEESMHSSSGNPLYMWDTEKKELDIVSNSSFLNFNLFFALSNAITTARIGQSYLLGAYRYAVSRMDNISDADAIVQPQKALSALHLRDLSIPQHFSIVESEGVEDVCDRTLEAVIVFREAIELLEQSMSIVKSFPTDM